MGDVDAGFQAVLTVAGIPVVHCDCDANVEPSVHLFAGNPDGPEARHREADIEIIEKAWRRERNRDGIGFGQPQLSRATSLGTP